MRDNGIGIPPDMLPRVFEMFTQVDRTLERAQGGLGIGLTLVQAAGRDARRHASRRAATGRPRQRVHRPPAASLAHADAGRADAEQRRRPRRTAGRRRVLVVDDNRDAADSLALMLELARATRCASPTTASRRVDAAAEFRPDVILLDIGMPGMNGYEPARRIRRRTLGQATSSSSPSPAGARTRTAAARKRPASTTTSSNRRIRISWSS